MPKTMTGKFLLMISVIALVAILMNVRGEFQHVNTALDQITNVDYSADYGN